MRFTTQHRVVGSNPFVGLSGAVSELGKAVRAFSPSTPIQSIFARRSQSRIEENYSIFKFPDKHNDTFKRNHGRLLH
jgi:hypothetical protein